MKYRAFAIALVFCSLALPAAAQEEKGGKPRPAAKVYKTPQEVFDAIAAAGKKKDFRLVADCLTPDAQKDGAVGLAITGILYREDHGDLSKEDEKTAKAFKALFGVMDEYRLTPDAVKKLKIKSPIPSKENREAIAKLIKHPPAFFAAFLAAQHKLPPAHKVNPLGADAPESKLSEVKIDGDTATATMAVTFRRKVRGKDESRTINSQITFQKIAGSWRIDPWPKDKRP